MYIFRGQGSWKRRRSLSIDYRIYLYKVRRRWSVEIFYLVIKWKKRVTTEKYADMAFYTCLFRKCEMTHDGLIDHS